MILFDPSVTPIALSFIFVFAIVFGLLSSANTIGFKKSINILLAIVFAAFSSVYQPFVSFVQEVMPIASIFLIILFFILFLKKITGGKSSDGKASTPADLLPLGIAMALLLVILSTMGDRIAAFLPAGIDVTTVYWISGILVILLLFWIGYSRFSTP